MAMRRMRAGGRARARLQRAHVAGRLVGRARARRQEGRKGRAGGLPGEQLRLARGKCAAQALVQRAVQPRAIGWPAQAVAEHAPRFMRPQLQHGLLRPARALARRPPLPRHGLRAHPHGARHAND